jgi:hypothetical protein
MRYWFDTEFIEDGRTIDLLSIGIVAEDGRELYLENAEADLSKASEWVRDNVLPHLGKHPLADSFSRTLMAKFIREFCDPDQYGKPEFWAYYADYDWVVLCQLFGRMIDLPKGWPMYCRDLKQLADMLGKPKLPEQGKGEHHALADARWNRKSYDFLVEYGYAAGFPATMLRA